MAFDANSLMTLETLMTEFFDGRTTNDRKRQIEELLNNFSNDTQSWKHCLYFLEGTRNEYVMMYSMTVLENLINKQWIGLLGVNRMEIRSSLYKLLLNHHGELACFLRNKLVKLVVDIGRLDWPHFYPDFFTNILQLVQQQETVTLGLIMLQTTSEEMICPRENLSVSRKEEIHRLLLEQVPVVLNILTGILESVVDKYQHLVTATPPPSPTHGQSSSMECLFNATPLQTGSLLSSAFKSLSNKNPFHNLSSLDSESHYICHLTLSCLNQLFGWIPLSLHISPTLLNIIFHYVNLGCESVYHKSVNQYNSRDLSSHSSSSSSHFNAQNQFSRNSQIAPMNSGPSLAVIAMSCINEIMSKNCVPTSSYFDDFLLQVFQNAFQLLQRITKESHYNNSNMTANGDDCLSNLDENFIEKFTEFLRLFMGVPFRRFESNSQFPVLEFLSLFFKYTFQQPTREGFFACLEIWTIFLDFLVQKMKNGKHNSTVIEGYSEALVSLVVQIHRKFQFKFNQAELEELDDETLNYDQETEWQHFLHQCLDVVAKVAELSPEETCHILYSSFLENMQTYLGLEQFVVLDGGNRKLTITGENECPRLHCVLRDLASGLQAFGVLADRFIGDAFLPWYNQTKDIVEKVCHMASYGSRVCLFNVITAVPNVLQADFIELHAQALNTLKAFISWINQLYNGAATKDDSQKALVHELISVIFTAALPMINKEVPNKILLTSAQLLSSISGTVRPTNMLQMPPMKDMLNRIDQGKIEQLNIDAQLLVYRAFNNAFLLPWRNTIDSDQQWPMRSENHNRFIDGLTTSYRQLRNNRGFVERSDLQERAKSVITRTLLILQYLIEGLQGENTKSKQIFFQNTKESIEATLPLLEVYISQPDICELILRFFLSLFEVLRVQMGVPFAERVVQTFLSLFTREQLADTILQENSMGSKVIERFLKILQLIIQEPGTAFKSFLPNTINLCMDHIYPILNERTSPDIKLSIFELLYQILVNNWRYFFKANIMPHNSAAGQERVENQEQFIHIMQAFGQSFLDLDIAIFRQNLEALESLNSKWKLYHKGIFKEIMLIQFLNVLLQVLVHKSHDLLQEEIAITIYNMAAVNFDIFYSTFLPQFLQNSQGLDDTQKSLLSQSFKMEIDLPSFTRSIHRLVNDLGYYRLCNDSVSPQIF